MRNNDFALDVVTDHQGGSCVASAKDYDGVVKLQEGQKYQLFFTNRRNVHALAAVYVNDVLVEDNLNIYPDNVVKSIVQEFNGVTQKIKVEFTPSKQISTGLFDIHIDLFGHGHHHHHHHHYPYPYPYPYPPPPPYYYRDASKPNDNAVVIELTLVNE